MTEKMHNKESREYEVEVRADIPEADFESLLSSLSGQFGEPKNTEMKTFLFRSPSGYGRIRILKGHDHGTLTEKIGNYADKAREEINKDFDFREVDEILEELRNKGLVECSYLRSTGHEFSGPNNQKLYLSQHEHLGNFLEVETLTKEKSEIEKAHDAVAKTLRDLDLRELPAAEYQALMNQMYAKTLKPVSEYKDQISQF